MRALRAREGRARPGGDHEPRQAARPGSAAGSAGPAARAPRANAARTPRAARSARVCRVSAAVSRREQHRVVLAGVFRQQRAALDVAAGADVGRAAERLVAGRRVVQPDGVEEALAFGRRQVLRRPGRRRTGCLRRAPRRRPRRCWRRRRGQRDALVFFGLRFLRARGLLCADDLSDELVSLAALPFEPAELLEEPPPPASSTTATTTTATIAASSSAPRMRAVEAGERGCATRSGRAVAGSDALAAAGAAGDTARGGARAARDLGQRRAGQRLELLGERRGPRLRLRRAVEVGARRPDARQRPSAGRAGSRRPARAAPPSARAPASAASTASAACARSCTARSSISSMRGDLGVALAPAKEQRERRALVGGEVIQSAHRFGLALPRGSLAAAEGDS